MTDITEQHPLTLTEERMLRVLRHFAAEDRLSEHGQLIRQSRLEDLVRRLSKVRQVPGRPVDDAAGSPRVRPQTKRHRPSVSRLPEVIPPAPDADSGGVECEAGCGEPSVGWRFYVDHGWRARCSRHLSGAGPAVRRMDAEQRVSFGPGSVGVSE